MSELSASYRRSLVEANAGTTCRGTCDLEQAGLPLVQVKEAMASIGYGKHALHELDRWESKRTTGKFGR
jgi:hypothetical protein